MSIAIVAARPHGARIAAMDWGITPASRPLRRWPRAQVQEQFTAALAAGDGLAGAHCIHELWMRADLVVDIGAALEQLWARAAASIPEWLPMTWFDFLPQLYAATARFAPSARGRSNLYLVLLDYGDRRGRGHGVYVGMSRYGPAERFDQHKAGIRAAGSVLKRGLEVLTGPTLHLQHIRRREAAAIEAQLAEVLRAEGLQVEGGH